MSVRDALLGILTLGPAYGLQLHFELGARAPHRAATNVGQIYATLERLSKAGLIASAGTNSEGLPLWQLTEQGHADALRWLSGETLTSLPEFGEVLDAVLIARSVNGSATEVLLGRLKTVAERNPIISTNELYNDAVHAHNDALLSWILQAQTSALTGEKGYQLARPKRGRPARAALTPTEGTSR